MTIHVSEEEFARDAARLLSELRGGTVVVVERDGRAVLTLRGEAGGEAGWSDEERAWRRRALVEQDHPLRARLGLPTEPLPVPGEGDDGSWDIDDPRWTRELFGPEYASDPSE